MPECHQGITLMQAKGLRFPPQPHIFQSSPPKKKLPLGPPMEPLHKERCSISRALSACLSKSPEKKPPLQVPLTEPLHTERCSISRALFTYTQNSPKRSRPSRFASQSPTETDAPFPEPFSTCLSHSPVKEPPSLQVPHQGPDGERCSSPRPILYNSQNSQ
jgi:hypothetical protein